MNTNDFKRIANALPDDGYVGFEIADLPSLFAEYEKLGKGHKAIPIKIRDFEMNYIGDEDDEISVLTFELYRD